MKPKLTNIYIFCTFRGQLILLMIFMFISLVNNTEISSCMDNEQAGKVMLVCEDVVANHNYTPQEIELLLAQINNIQDPQLLETARQRITIIAGVYNVDINSFLIPQLLQHPIPNGARNGNSGDIPLEPIRDWNDLLKAFLLAVTISLVAYLIFRHWSDMTLSERYEIFSDVIIHTPKIPELLVDDGNSREILINDIILLLNNPETRQITAHVLNEVIGAIGLPTLPNLPA